MIDSAHYSGRSQYTKHGLLYVHHDYECLLRSNDLCDFDALMNAAGEKSLVKKGLSRWRERIQLTLQSSAGPVPLFLKRYNRPPFWMQLKRILRRVTGMHFLNAGNRRPLPYGRGSDIDVTASSLATIEVAGIRMVAELGISAPVPVAFGCRLRGMREQQSLLLMTAVGGQSLETWLPLQVQANGIPVVVKRRLIDALAALVSQLHAGGVVHRDLYLSHIFIRPRSTDIRAATVRERSADSSIHDVDYRESETSEMELSLIDLQRVFKPRWRKRRWFIKDLAALNYSTRNLPLTRADRLRFYRQYAVMTKKLSQNSLWHRLPAGDSQARCLCHTCEMVSKLNPEHKATLRRIEAKTNRIAQHSRKHGLG